MPKVFCDDCIKILAGSMSEESRKVFGAFVESKQPLSEAEMIRKSNLTRALTKKGKEHLVANNFIKVKETEGRAYKYWVTKNGVKLAEILSNK